MIINRAYRYELYPNVEQRTLLAKYAGAARFAFNWGLARRIEQYERDKIYGMAQKSFLHHDSSPVPKPAVSTVMYW